MTSIHRPRKLFRNPIPGMALLAGVAAGWVGCSHAPPAKSQDTADSNWKNTSITISYALHQDRRELSMDAHSDPIQVQSLMDGSALKKSTINAEHYRAFLSQVRDFVEKRRNPASLAPTQPPADCRSPYWITLKNPKSTPKDTIVIEGCRTGDDGSFGHLIKEGEFLIYRQK